MKPTQEQVIAWAREAGIEAIYSACDEPNVRYAYEDWDNELERFAALAYEAGRKDENEACARVCDEKVEAEYATGKVDHNEMGWTQACAIAIRARGQ